MAHKATLVLVMMCACTARGQFFSDTFGTFERVPGCTSCTPSSIYPAFDTWVFEIWSNAPSGALSLNFKAPAGGFIDALPGTGYRDVAANPVQSNVEIPETFFLVPSGATALSATLVDTTMILQSDYTTAAQPLVPGGNVHTPVAFFSVPAGTILDQSNFLGLSSLNPEPTVIKYIVLPEPMSCSLALMSLPAILFGRRRRFGRSTATRILRLN